MFELYLREGRCSFNEFCLCLPQCCCVLSAFPSRIGCNSLERAVMGDEQQAGSFFFFSEEIVEVS